MITPTDHDSQDLITMNRLDDILTPDCNDQVIKVAVITRSTKRRRESPTIMQEEVVQNMRLDRINMRRSSRRCNRAGCCKIKSKCRDFPRLRDR